jgi:hypothetical protein
MILRYKLLRMLATPTSRGEVNESAHAGMRKARIDIEERLAGMDDALAESVRERHRLANGRRPI